MSCVSAVAIHDALVAAGHRIVPVGIAKDGAWYLADPSRRPLRPEGRPVRLDVPAGELQAGEDAIGFDVAFPVLHGPYGEDGTLQGVFETIGVPYVGCGVLASALGMDKDLAKRVVRSAGVPVVPWMPIAEERFLRDPSGVVDDAVGRCGLPAFVKPACLGSSVGISRAEDEAGVKDALVEAFRHGTKAVVEPEVTAREIEVAVLDGPRTAPPGEVHPGRAWYDYQAKYHDDRSRFEVPARLTPPQADEVQRLAALAFEVMGCRGLARVDFLFEEGGRGFLFNELNTMPGFTPISGFPKMWEAAGMSYAELCDGLVQAALRAG